MVEDANPFESLQAQVDAAAAYVDAPADVIERLKHPERTLSVTLGVRLDDGTIGLFDGYRVQFNGARGPYKGGIRYHPSVTRDEVTALAGWMVYKCATVGIPYGGGKGGIALDPGAYSMGELERITRAYATELRPFIGEDVDIPGPDVNTGQQEMNWIKDTYETLEGRTAPGVSTGKSIAAGGSEGRVEATGRSVMLAAREVCRYLGRGVEDATVAVQGYGNAGSIAAHLLADQGARIVAVSDSSGGAYDPDGFDPRAVLEHKHETGTVVEYPGTETLTSEEILTLDVDLLIPAALENAVDEDVAERVRADVIVEAANGPLTPAADRVLADRDVTVVPDIYANAGGVTVSYFEWVQNRQRHPWSEARVNRELEQAVTTAFENIATVHEDRETPDLRTATYALALERVITAMDANGTWP